MENLTVRTIEEAREKIEARGGRLQFLPAHRPAFNPVEHAFYEFNGCLRKARTLPQGTLQSTTGASLATMTAKDAHV